MASASFGPQFPTLVPRPISLSLFKLSFCTAANLRSNLLWTHLPDRDNLFAVFDSLSHKDLEGSVTEKKVLKLVRGGDLLFTKSLRVLPNKNAQDLTERMIQETIELDNLALQARLDEERSKSQHLQDVDRHVIIMVKKPLLAIRYQLPTGQIRRLQMNFRPESGFNSAYLALQALTLPIRDRSQPSNHSLSNYGTPPVIHPSVMMHQTRQSGLIQSSEFNFRPITSNGFEHRPSSSAHEAPSVRPSTAPMSFSQMLPPRRELPFATSNPRLPNHESSLVASKDGQNVSSQHTPCGGPQPGKKSCAKKAKNGSQTHGVNPESKHRRQSSIAKPRNRKSRAQPANPEPSPSEAERGTEVVPDNQQDSLETGLQVHSDGIVLKSHTEKPQSRPATQAKDQQGRLPVPTTSRTSSSVVAHENLAAAERQIPTPLVLRVGSQALAAITANENNTRQNRARPKEAEVENASQTSLPIIDVSPEDYMNRLDEWVRNYQHLPAPEPRPKPNSDLADYAAQPEEDRLAILDTMICECLEDQNFVKLVEDVDKSWKRIGLGF